MPNLLDVKNLSISFSTYLGKIRAVRSISFTVQKGETVAIVGESGCGKSATAQAIMGLITQPTGLIEDGEILFQGNDLLRKTKNNREKISGKEIGMIFQDPMTSLNPTMRVGKQIMEGIVKHQKIKAKHAQSRTVELLELVGISDPEKRIHQYPHELSGGMRQRVMIAIALACNPKLLIADEPTTALDVTIQAQILDLMKKIQAKMGMSIILITHDLGIVATMCDRVIVMYGGQIVECGTVQQIYSKPQHPYTQGLLRSIPRLDLNRNEELIPIYGTPPSLMQLPRGCAFCPRCPFAMRICEKESPDLEPLQKNHQVACWLKRKNEQTLS